MAGKKGLKKRFWSDDEKRTICAQTLTPGVSVAQVARRYSMNANLIFKWLKDPRFAPAEGGSSPEESIALEGVFLALLFWRSAWISRCRTDGAFWWKARRRWHRSWAWYRG